MFGAGGDACIETCRDDLGMLPKPLVVNLEADGVVADASSKLGFGMS